jgi:NTP pyrophosphatase (non-canonical NTP hydrolase)
MSNKWIGTNELTLTEQIKEYYTKRALKHPNVWEALGWATAELGEVYEVLMSFAGGWVRNNPEDHPTKTKEDLAEELGDVIFMLVIAGIEEGVDPIQALQDKMKRKLKEKSATFTTTLQEVTEEDFNGNNN